MVTKKNPPTWRPLRPNILITGTPGTGKSTLSAEVSTTLGLRHIDLGDFAKERHLLAGHDDNLDCDYLHEDAVLDALEPIMADGGVVLDHHSSDWFPERWIQMAVVLRATTEALYDRLQERRYAPRKLEQNMQAEIMQVCRDEAEESYPNARFIELDSSGEEQLASNLATLRREWAILLRKSESTDDVER